MIDTDGAWQSDAELDKYRQAGCVLVHSSDGRYSGLAEIPNTNKWEKLILAKFGITLSVPANIGAFDSSDWVSVAFYSIHGHYRDSRTAAQVEVRKKSKNERQAHAASLEKIIAMSWEKNDPRSIETRWDELQFHPKTESRGGLFRRDIECADGSLIYIRGTGEGLTVASTGEDLYAGMVNIIRIIMDSIEPLNVSTNR
jgi:hypothetical protein